MRADIRFLSSDLLEGRGPGDPRRSHSPASTSRRASRRSASSRAPPAAAGSSRSSSWASRPRAPESVRVSPAGRRRTCGYARTTSPSRGRGHAEARTDDAEIVFVGYGIVAPEHDWDDYKGADLRGKVLLVMNNDPESDPRAVRRQAPALLRPLGLQVRDGGPTRRRRGDRHPHRRLGRLQLVGGPDLVVRASSSACRPCGRAASCPSRPGPPRTPAAGSRGSAATTSTRCVRRPRSATSGRCRSASG